MEKEKVSIIIPTYNRAYCIEKSIRSVLQQTYRDFELLIVDDGSTDNTEEVVKNIGDDRIRYIKMPENRGASAARNEGVRQAAYEYIAFQDSDDEWKPDKLVKQMRVLVNSPKRTGVVYHCFESWIGNVRWGIIPNQTIPMQKKRGSMYRSLLECNKIGTPTALLRKECFEKSGLFNEDLTCLEDWEFFIRVAKDYEIAFIEEVLLTVYHRADGISANNVEGYIETVLYIAEQHKNVLREYGLLDDLMRDVLTRARGSGISISGLGNKIMQLYLQ